MCRQMKKLLLAGIAVAAFCGVPALAADMAFKAPPPPAPAFSWAGFYLGINGGYSLANDPFSQTLSEAGVTAAS